MCIQREMFCNAGLELISMEITLVLKSYFENMEIKKISHKTNVIFLLKFVVQYIY